MKNVEFTSYKRVVSSYDNYIILQINLLKSKVFFGVAYCDTTCATHTYVWKINGIHRCCMPQLILNINTERFKEHGSHSAEKKCIISNENQGILIQNSLRFVPKDCVYSKSALIQIMPWHRTDAKPLPVPMLTKFHDTTWYLLATKSYVWLTLEVPCYRQGYRQILKISMIFQYFKAPIQNFHNNLKSHKC